MAHSYIGPPFNETENRQRVLRLRTQGVHVWSPERVYIGPDIRPERIEAGAVLLNAVLSGEQTYVGCKSRIGVSGMAVITNTQIGEGVELGAGSYEGATLLDGVKTRGFAELRPNTLLEEEVEIGHNVGLKNTILTTAVVAGSSINFCDVFMSGGRSRRDHSEIGSGTVHFNYDPRGDKFGSLIGDATGVLLSYNRIFVGGNTGLVAPIHLDFGCVIPAGTTVRTDVGANVVFDEPKGHLTTSTYNTEIYHDLRRKFLATAKLVGNLHALLAWYQHVRITYANESALYLYEAAQHQIIRHIQHRASETDKIIGKLPASLVAVERAGLTHSYCRQHRRLIKAREQIYNTLFTSNVGVSTPPKKFLDEYGRARKSYAHCEAISHLSKESCNLAANWLRDIATVSLRKIARIFDTV